ncbi:MAG: hypothetical protein ACRC2R_23960 [Xenococcaceae cyanobacterium]
MQLVDRIQEKIQREENNSFVARGKKTKLIARWKQIDGKLICQWIAE